MPLLFVILPIAGIFLLFCLDHDLFVSEQFWRKIVTGVSAAFVLGLLAFFGYYLFFLNHVAPPYIGVAYDSSNGSIVIQDHPGWYSTGFFTSVHYIDPRPTQVCLGGGARVMNCKLIAFNIKGVSKFIELQGFSQVDYNSSKFCIIGQSNNETTKCTGMAEVLAGYAFSNQPQSFYDVIEETKPTSVAH